MTVGRSRALFLTQFFPPETFAGANRTHAIARALAETHDLRVVTLNPSYPQPHCYELEATARFDAAAPFSIKRRSSFTPHRYRTPIGRAIREMWATLLLGARALVVPADTVITSSPSMFLGPVALAVARVKGARFIWDVRDVTWTMAVEQNVGGRLASLLHTVMWKTGRRCDLFVAATPGIARVALKAGVDPDRIVTVENGITSDLRIVLSGGRPRTERSCPVVTYVGLLGRAQQLATLVEAAQRLPHVQFVIVGEGPQRTEVEELIRTEGCQNVRLQGYVRPELLPGVFAASDILFAQVVDAPTLNETARPSKLFEYMAAGRAIVYAGYGDAADLITEIGCGIAIPPADPVGLAAAIQGLLEDPPRLVELGRRGAAYVDALPSREERMKCLADTVRQRFSAAGAI